MKLPLSVIILLNFCFISATAQSGDSADQMLQKACVQAGKENKKVFIMFTASWCGWCHRMDKSMNDEDCKKYFDDNFLILHFVVDEIGEKKNLETPGGAAFRTRFGGDGQGIPFWLIFDKDGNLVADSMKPDGSTGGKLNTGCPAEPPEVDYFISVLRTTTELKEDQLEKISKRFLKNGN